MLRLYSLRTVTRFDRAFCTLAGEEKAVVPRKTFHSVNPATGQTVPQLFEEATVDEVHEAAMSAMNAFTLYRSEPVEVRAKFLETIAEEIVNLGEELIQVCEEETALPLQRLVGERGRTVNQLKMFAELIREGYYLQASIDTPIPDRVPVAKPDLRTMNIPIGPVAVFGACNFPLAFSTAGGDTASALAAGCPVVYKAHPAQPYTSELVGRAIKKAVERCDLPPGTFNMLHSYDNEVGVRLVQEPAIQAVGFTGSYRAGRALTDLANARYHPIPVYAEMGSSNPIFILPNALADQSRLNDMARNFATSVTMGCGQFCTQPGIVFMRKDKGVKRFLEILTEDIMERVPESMLTKDIADSYNAQVEALQNDSRFKVVAKSHHQLSRTINTGTPLIFKSTCKEFLKDLKLEDEIFGPCTIIFEAEDNQELLRCAERLQGHLTVTVHGVNADFDENIELMDILQDKAGRIVINGFPTSVDVCYSMIHGGPFPSSTVPRSTSVGGRAIERFLRPVCYQNAPQNVLPEALQDDNPLGIVRNIDGILSTYSIGEFNLHHPM